MRTLHPIKNTVGRWPNAKLGVGKREKNCVEGWLENGALYGFVSAAEALWASLLCSSGAVITLGPSLGFLANL